MTLRTPTRSVHFRIADALEGLMSMGRGGDDIPSLTVILLRHERDLNLRGYYLGVVVLAWGAIGGFFTFSLAFIGVPVRLVLGEGVGHVVLSALLAASFFSFTGFANTLWRRQWYVAQARRRLERDGPDSEGYAKSMRRMLPRNSSLIWQSIVGVLTFAIVIA